MTTLKYYILKWVAAVGLLVFFLLWAIPWCGIYFLCILILRIRAKILGHPWRKGQWSDDTYKKLRFTLMGLYTLSMIILVFYFTLWPIFKEDFG